jgi:hypothetical protein
MYLEGLLLLQTAVRSVIHCGVAHKVISASDAVGIPHIVTRGAGMAHAETPGKTKTEKQPALLYKKELQNITQAEVTGI